MTSYYRFLVLGSMLFCLSILFTLSACSVSHPQQTSTLEFQMNKNTVGSRVLEPPKMVVK